MYLLTGDYKFELDICNDSDFKEVIRIGMIKEPRAYVEIHVEHDDSASIQSTEYDSVCCKDDDETIQMIKVALILCINRHKYIKMIVVVDDAFYPINDNKRILISPSRLLTGRLGWYQEYLGAEPSLKTLNMIKRIKPIQDNQNLEYWTFENIKEIAEPMLKERFGSLFGSTWTISKDTIMSYNIHYILQDIPKKIHLIKRKYGKPVIHFMSVVL